MVVVWVILCCGCGRDVTVVHAWLWLWLWFSTYIPQPLPGCRVSCWTLEKGACVVVLLWYVARGMSRAIV